MISQDKHEIYLTHANYPRNTSNTIKGTLNYIYAPFSYNTEMQDI